MGIGTNKISRTGARKLLKRLLNIASLINTNNIS